MERVRGVAAGYEGEAGVSMDVSFDPAGGAVVTRCTRVVPQGAHSPGAVLAIVGHSDGELNEALPVPVITTSLTGLVTGVNGAARALLGQAGEDVVGAPLGSFVVGSEEVINPHQPPKHP